MYCSICGKALGETGGCPSCGQARPKFCSRCGGPLPESGDCSSCVNVQTAVTDPARVSGAARLLRENEAVPESAGYETRNVSVVSPQGAFGCGLSGAMIG